MRQLSNTWFTRDVARAENRLRQYAVKAVAVAKDPPVSRNASRALLLLVVMLPIITAGCGAGAAIIAAFVCTPIGWIAVAGLAIATVAVLFIYDGNDGDRPNRTGTPGPAPQPEPDTLRFYVENAEKGISDCPIRRIRIKVEGSARYVWAFDAHGPNQPGDEPGSVRFDPKRMSWPRNFHPIFEDGTTASGTHLTGMLVFEDVDGDGIGDRWVKGPVRAQITITFANPDQPEELDLGWQWIEPNTTFVVGWHPTQGARLINTRVDPFGKPFIQEVEGLGGEKVQYYVDDLGVDELGMVLPDGKFIPSNN